MCLTYFIADLVNCLKMSDRKAVIKNADMSEEMQQDAVDCATQVYIFTINSLVFFCFLYVNRIVPD